tara:strand:+ start:1041 stop:5102 length:4062 start_codon:yes stop_codon:yes gene_type:complete
MPVPEWLRAIQENPPTIEEAEESSGLGGIFLGLGTEISVAGVSQVAAAASGPIGYFPIAFGGGFAASVAAQKLEGDEFSFGRAVAAGMLNLIPGSAGVKTLTKGLKAGSKAEKLLKAAANGDTLYGTTTIPASIIREAKRGAAFGLGEIVVKNLIDEQRLPTQDELFQYLGAGAVLGGGLGGIMGGFISRNLGKRVDEFAKEWLEDAPKTWSKMDIDQKVATAKDVGIIVGDSPDLTSPIFEKDLNQQFEQRVKDFKEGHLSELAYKAAAYNRDFRDEAEKTYTGAFIDSLKAFAPSFTVGHELTSKLKAIEGTVQSSRKIGETVNRRTDELINSHPGRNVEQDVQQYLTRPTFNPTIEEFLGVQYRDKTSKKIVSRVQLPEYLDEEGFKGELDSWKEKRTELQRRLLPFVKSGTVTRIRKKGNAEDIAILDDMLSESGSDISETIKLSIGNENYMTQEWAMFVDPNFSPKPEKENALIKWMIKNHREVNLTRTGWGPGRKRITERLKEKNIPPWAKEGGKSDGKPLEGDPLIKKQRLKAKEIIVDRYYSKAANPKLVSIAGKATESQSPQSKVQILLGKNDELPDVLIDFLGGNLTNPKTGQPFIGEKAAGTIALLSRKVASMEAHKVLIEDLYKRGELNIIQIGETIIEPRSNLGEVVETLNLFNGKVVAQVTPEMADALQKLELSGFMSKQVNNSADAAEGIIGDVYGSMVGLSKAVKVILNPASYSANAIGAAVAALASGNFNLVPLVGSRLNRGTLMAMSEYSTIKNLAGKVGSPEYLKGLNDDIVDMVRFDMMNANVSASDLRKTLGTGKTGEFLQKIVDPFSKAYQVSDNAYRFVTWKGNIDKLTKMFPQPEGFNLSQYTEEIKRAAAIVTNNTFQNYNRLSKIQKTLSRLGITPPFAAFTAELTRNLFNNVKYIAQMTRGTFGREGLGLSQGLIKNANTTAMRGEGVLRGVILGGLTVGAYVGVDAANKELGVDKEKMEALKNTVIPDYDRSKEIVVSLNEDGTSGHYFNASYLNPYAQFNRLLRATQSGTSPINKLSEMASVVADEFVGRGSFVFQELGDALRGLDAYGNPISFEENKAKRVMDGAQHFMAETFSPGFIREAKLWEKALKGYGDYETQDLIKRMIGFRMYAFDLKKDTKYKIRPSNTNLQEAVRGYSYIQRSEGVSPQQLETAYNDANSSRVESLDKLKTIVDSLRVLGQSEDDIISTFKDSRVSSSNTIQLMQGSIQPMERVVNRSTADLYEELVGDSFEATERNINANVKDPGEKKRLIAHLEKQKLYDKRNISGFDKLLLSLDTRSRASTLINVLGVSTTNTVLINEYRKKGIITDSVYEAIRLRETQSRY